MQTDLFSGDEVRSFPPHLDPARACDVEVDEEDDRDHVAEPVNGLLPIGAVGSNRTVWVVRVRDRDNAVLHAESFPSRSAAESYAGTIWQTLLENRQQTLL